MTIGFVTSMELGGITPDDCLIAAVLTDLGMQARVVFWDGAEAPGDLDALVLRSPWNYHLNPQAFLRWIDRAARHTLVCNSPPVIRWNAHKAYLFELQRAGIRVAETVLCHKQNACDLRAIMDERSWNQVVIKPAISASSFMTSIVGLPADTASGEGRFGGRIVENGQHLLNNILETRDALVQPFMPEISERGERCLIFIDGQFSHAVQKAPFTDSPGGGRPIAAEHEEIDIAQRALAVLPEKTLYARVDLLRAADGADRLMELELIDPELYMRFDSNAPRKFAAALMRRIRDGQNSRSHLSHR